MANKEPVSEVIRAQDVNVFDRWALPSFDSHDPQAEPEVADEVVEAEPPATHEIEDVEPESVQPMTLEQLEAIRQEAYNEGFSTGEKDGFHAGQLKARQEAQAALEPKLAALEQVMNQLFEPINEQDHALEMTLVKLVSHIAREVVQRELTTDSSNLRQVLRAALKLLPSGAENISIHLNPQDYDQIKALRDRHEEDWRIIEDDALLPGGCRVESNHSRVDASIETRLSQALKQLFDQQREQSVHPLTPDLNVDLDNPDAP